LAQPASWIGDFIMPTPTPGRRALLGGAASLMLTHPLRAWADGPPPPPVKPILTVAGKISQTNDKGLARFDRPMLEALGTETFSTGTPWFDHKVAFEGVPMARVMDAVGADGDRVRAVALDDYAIELPMADFITFGTLLALKLAGRYMTVADKGPCFIVYPFDRYPQLQSARFYARSLWQVSSLVVL
jgi:hypothetical protein